MGEQPNYLAEKTRSHKRPPQRHCGTLAEPTSGVPLAADVERMVAANVARLRAEMHAQGLAALLVSRIDHYHYVTGLKTLDIKWYLHRQAALVTGDALVCLPPLPDEEAARSTGRFTAVRGLPLTHAAWPATLAAVLAEHGVGDGLIGYDPSLPFLVVDGLSRLAGGRLLDAGEVLARARAVKNSDEIALIRQALTAVEGALRDGFAALKPGLRETDLSALVAGSLLRRGADGFAFPPIVSSGLNFAVPLRYATEKAIGEGELVNFCAAALKGGYYGELHRMSATAPPTGEPQDIYHTVRAALQCAIASIRPGAPLQAMDDALRSVVREAGYGPYGQKHVTGHGLGCNVLDYPLIGDPGSPAEGVFAPGMVVHVVSGVFKPGVCGCRVSELVAVTDEGHEVLSSLEHPFASASPG